MGGGYMPRHPTVQVPNIGPMDHAWDLLGEWQAELELPETEDPVHLTDAGGGALQWVLHAPSTNWSLQATMWPGSLHLFVHDADDEEEQLYRARATRDQEYYLRKYPLEAGDKP
jgi:hypothetical protein